MIHELAISPERFDAVAQDIKPFVVCKNFKPLKVGDVLLLRELDDGNYQVVAGTYYTGRETCKVITYILNDPDYCKEGYVVLGLAPVKEGSE